MDESTRMLVVGVGAPLVIGGVAGLVAAVMKRGRGRAEGAEETGSAQAVAIVGVMAAMVVGLYGMVGMPAWPVRSAGDRVFLLPPLAGLVALAGVVVAVWRGGRGVGGERRLEWRVAAASAGIAAAAGTVVVLGERFRSGELAGMGGKAGVVWVPLAMGMWSAANAWGVGRVARGWARTSGVIVAGLAVAVGAGLLGDSNTLGQEGFAIAMGVVGLVFGAMVGRGAAGPGAVGASCGVMGAMMAYGALIGYTPWWVVGVLGLVGPGAAAADAALRTRTGSVGGSMARIGVAAVIAGIAVVPGVAALVRFVMETGGQ